MKKYTIKVIIIGDANVGKTSLMNQYISSTFSNSYKATIGAEFLSKQLVFEDKEVSMQVWDTAGQEKFQSVQRVFYRGSDACVIVFDLTSPTSFANVGKWKKEFFQAAGISNPEKYPMVLIGNKADLAAERKVATAKAQQWCKENGGIQYFETSAKTSSNVQEAFEDIAIKAVEKQKSRLIIGDIGTIKTGKKLTQDTSAKKSGGCSC